MRVLITLLLVCGIAHADKRAAEKLFSAGAKAYAAQNFGAAAQLFDEAYKELAIPEIAFSAAQAYRRLYRVDPNPQHVKRAVELYRIYLDKVKTGGRVGDASDSLGEMERELDKLETKGKVKFDAAVVEHTRLGVNITIADQATPDAGTLREIGEGTGKALEGVTATLDGKPIEPSALVDVPAGEHTVAVSAAGYFPVEKKQRVVQGVTSLVDIELKPKPAKVTVKTEAGARVMVDGRPATTMLELATGKHQLAVLRTGREPWGREISVTRGQDLTLAAPLEKTGRRRAVPWVLGGAGGLTLLCVVNGIAAVVADNKAIDLRAQISAGNAAPSVADDYDGKIKERDRFRTASLVLGGGALIATAVGLGLYFFDSPSPAKLENKLQLAPAVGPGTAGVTAMRRF